MTVKLLDAEVLSAASKKRDPTKYKWYQLAKGKAKFDSSHDEFELELRKGEKFGLKFFAGSYFLVDEDDLSVQFKLSADEGKKLIKASEPWSGKISGKQVKPGDGALATKGPGTLKIKTNEMQRWAKDAGFALAKPYRTSRGTPSYPVKKDPLVRLRFGPHNIHIEVWRLKSENAISGKVIGKAKNEKELVALLKKASDAAPTDKATKSKKPSTENEYSGLTKAQLKRKHRVLTHQYRQAGMSRGKKSQERMDKIAAQLDLVKQALNSN